MVAPDAPVLPQTGSGRVNLLLGAVALLAAGVERLHRRRTALADGQEGSS